MLFTKSLDKRRNGTSGTVKKEVRRWQNGSVWGRSYMAGPYTE
jgi:hypothetical protein